MRRRRGLVVAILVVLLIALLLLLRGCDHAERCGQNLNDLSHAWLEMPEDRQREFMRFRGSALLLALRKSGRVFEEALRCPDDPDLRPLDDAARRAYDEVDLANPPDDLCSYAVRDFERYPLPADASRAFEIIACCRGGRTGRSPHHGDGRVVVLYANGDVELLSRERLGDDSGSTIVVGLESNLPRMRPMIQRPGK